MGEINKTQGKEAPRKKQPISRDKAGRRIGKWGYKRKGWVIFVLRNAKKLLITTEKNPPGSNVRKPVNKYIANPQASKIITEMKFPEESQNYTLEYRIFLRRAQKRKGHNGWDARTQIPNGNLAHRHKGVR